MIQRSRKLGTTQEAVLRNILFDVYAIKGYHPDNPLTWGDDGGPGRPAGLPEDRIYLDIPFEEKELAKDVARRDGTFVTFDREAGRGAWWTPRYTEGLRRWPMKTWGKSAPTIHDVISLTQLKLKQLWVGVDQKSMFALENYCRATAQMLKAVKSTVQRSGTGDPVLPQVVRLAGPRVAHHDHVAVDQGLRLPGNLRNLSILPCSAVL